MSAWLDFIDEAFDRRAWHGASLRGSIRGLSAAQAAWRPAPGRRSIAEIVLHAAYWKYVIRRRLRSEPRGSFPLRGSNWFALPEPFDAAAWREAIRLLGEQHAALRTAVAELPPRVLNAPHQRGSISPAWLVRGIAFHDIYHAGQIQTLKAMQRARR